MEIKNDTHEIAELRKQLGILRAEKFKVENELADSKEQVRIRTEENQKLNSAIVRFRLENETLNATVRQQLTEIEQAAKANDILKSSVSGLEREKKELVSKVSVLDGALHRPDLHPADLATSLSLAVQSMQESLKQSGGRVCYAVGQLDTEIRTNLMIGKDNALTIRLPDIGETTDPASLSTIKLSLKTAPAVSDTLVRVPLLKSLDRTQAVNAVKDLGLVPKTIEKPGRTHTGKVVDQDPEEYSEVSPGSTVRIVVATAEKITVPNLVNMEREDALKILGDCGLKPGNIESKPSSAKSGVIIAQSVVAGTKVDRQTGIDLTVSEKITPAEGKSLAKKTGKKQNT